MEELSDTEYHQDSSKVLSRRYNEFLDDAFDNSKEKESLEVKFKKSTTDFISGLVGLQQFHQPSREIIFLCFQQVANDGRLMVSNITEWHGLK